MYYLNIDLLDICSFDKWKDLIDIIKDLKYVRPFIIGHDYILYNIKDYSIDSPKSQDLISFRLGKKRVSIEIVHKKDFTIESFYNILFNTPFENICLFINHFNPIVKKTVLWRLEHHIY